MMASQLLLALPEQMKSLVDEVSGWVAGVTQLAGLQRLFAQVLVSQAPDLKLLKISECVHQVACPVSTPEMLSS